MKYIYLLFFFVLIPCIIYAQAPSKESYQLTIQKATGKIVLDGLLNEQDWQSAAIANNFYQSRPNDDQYATSKTEVRVTYDDRFLYIGAVCHDELEGDYVVQSLKRDFSFPITDAFAIFLDPFNNQTAGFSFAVSPLGMQREGLVQSGGQYGVTTSWNHKWFSKVTRHNDKWIAEIAIPFKTLRFTEGVDEWGINFARNDLKRIETSTWTPVPTQYNVASLAFAGKLQWDKAPSKTGANIAFIPYVSTQLSKDIEAGDTDVTFKPNAGFDAKIALSSSLNLDLTVNPDFSQVDVDRQVTNLDRFSIFLPEQRNFFLENSDLFRYGIGPVRPFFSRRIGLSGGELIPILLGARLTGNLTDNTRIGLMSVQTEGVAGTKSQNFSVATVQQKVLARSNVTGFLVNRQAFTGFSPVKNDYNRVGGVEFNFRSTDNKWEAFLQNHYTFTNRNDPSFEQGKLASRLEFVGGFGYDDRNWYGFLALERVGTNYTPDVGYARELFHRNDELGTSNPLGYWASLHFAGYRFYPEQWEKIRNWYVQFEQKVFSTSKKFSITDRTSLIESGINFNDGAFIMGTVRNYATQLYFPTNITGSMDSLLQADTYHFSDAGFILRSSKRNRFYGELQTFYGGFYNGNRLRIRTDLNYRIQPWGRFGVAVNYNEVRFPEGFGDARLFLVGPIIELTFTNNLFFTNFFQYNTQSENFNVNSRLQWRFAPMSDLFLVFSDNMHSSDFSQRDWGVVMKLSYWLTL